MNPSQRIKTIRLAKRWGQADVARAVRAGSGRFRSISNVSKLEKGRADKAPLDVLHALADALEVPREAVISSTHDRELDAEPKAIDFVTRQSLEMFAARRKLDPTEAESLRTTYKTIAEGPRDVQTWIMTFAYAEAIAHVRKPGALAPSRTSSKRGQQQRSG